MNDAPIIRCQSCGMPLSAGMYGTEGWEGTHSTEYCKFCYMGGRFIMPDLTVGEMVSMSVEQLVAQSHMPVDQAEQMMKELIPTLKRWKR